MDRGAQVGILRLAKVDMPLMHGWIDALKLVTYDEMFRAYATSFGGHC